MRFAANVTLAVSEIQQPGHICSIRTLPDGNLAIHTVSGTAVQLVQLHQWLL